MSRGSRIGVRAKQEWTKSLELVHKSEIDAFLRDQVIPTCRDCNADLSCHESVVCLECEHAKYDHDDFEDDYWGSCTSDEDWYDDRYDDLLNIFEAFDYDDAWWGNRSLLNPGSYYRDNDGHTYLCCCIDGRVLLVSMLTGREASVSKYQLELVA